jgi:hypothetical protein
MADWGIVEDELHDFEALPNRYNLWRVGCLFKS